MLGTGSWLQPNGSRIVALGLVHDWGIADNHRGTDCDLGLPWLDRNDCKSTGRHNVAYIDSRRIEFERLPWSIHSLVMDLLGPCVGVMECDRPSDRNSHGDLDYNLSDLGVDPLAKLVQIGSV